VTKLTKRGGVYTEGRPTDVHDAS